MVTLPEATERTPSPNPNQPLPVARHRSDILLYRPDPLPATVQVRLLLAVERFGEIMEPSDRLERVKWEFTAPWRVDVDTPKSKQELLKEYRDDPDPRVQWLAGMAYLNTVNDGLPGTLRLGAEIVCEIALESLGSPSVTAVPGVVARALLLKALGLSSGGRAKGSAEAKKTLKQLRKAFKKSDHPEVRQYLEAAEVLARNLPTSTVERIQMHRTIVDAVKTVDLDHPPWASGPEIDFAPPHKEVVAEGYFGGDDQRTPYMATAYVEWPGDRPERCRMTFEVTCHQCGSIIADEWEDFTGFVGGPTGPCPSCGSKVEIGNHRGWEEEGAKSGLYVYAVPYTTSVGAPMRLIEFRSLNLDPVD